MPTIPKIAYPVTLTASADLRLVYTDATEETVTVAAGTYWVQEDGTAADLLQTIETALLSAASVSTCEVALSSNRVRISILSTRTVDALHFDTAAQLLPFDLGYALDTTTTSVGFVAFGSSELAWSANRAPSHWIPSTEDFGDLITRQDVVVSQTAADGSGADDVYAGRKTSEHDIPEVYGALIRDQIVAIADHAASVNGLATGDTNATLEGWLTRLHGLLGGVRPTLRWTPDISTPATFRTVKITDPEMIGGVAGWITETNKAPLFHDLAFKLAVT